MCLILLAWQANSDYPLVVAANRDEIHARPAEPMHRWTKPEGLVAGRDGLAGGTWLGIMPNGRFAAVTNYHDPGLATGRRSRGELPVAFLGSQESPRHFLEQLGERAAEYAGFTLLVGDRETLWCYSHPGSDPQILSPGIHGLSNHRLNTPWPKVTLGRTLLQQWLADPARAESGLFDLLMQPQPIDGESSHQNRLFITGRDYGTRCSTTLLRTADGRLSCTERTFEPGGRPGGETRLTLSTETY